ncbi:MAG TPA: helix-turn-helix domain-containing protein [Clostridia bacterium]|nr:helix-turn-helix domain-containing protein [Clostridia bacterium]
MRLSQVKNIFSKIVPSVNEDLVLVDLEGFIIDSNQVKNHGNQIVVPVYESSKEMFSKGDYDFIFIKQYNSPQFLIGIKNNKETLNLIKLLFDEKKQEMTKIDFYRELLLGTIKREEFEELKYDFVTKDLTNLRAIAFKVDKDDLKNAQIIIDNIFVFDQSVLLDSETIIIITDRIDDEIIEYTNNIFSELTTELALKVTIAIGSKVLDLIDISDSVDDINNILRLADRFNIQKDVYYYEDFLIPLIVDNLPKEILVKFNKENLKKYDEIFKNKDLIFTAESFFKNDLNITETSEKIFVHRNTLIYRINKIKEISGFDLKKFDDAIRFYMILLIKNMNEK